MAKSSVSKILDMHNTITAKDLDSILTLQVNTLKTNPEKSKFIPPLMVWGPPGAGKSSIIQAVANREGIGFIDFRLSQVEPVDLRGLPVPNKEEKSVEWFVTAEFPRDPKSRGILLFDEISAADRSLQVAAYELILDRRLGKLYSLPDGWLVVAAGNRTEDRAVATTMSSALANRFMHVEIDPNSEDWIKWGAANDIHPAVLGFIKTRPENLFSIKNQNLERGWPSPRSWHRVSEMCKIYDKQKTNNYYLLEKIVYGLVGNSAGIDFMTYYKLNEEFDDILEYMTNPAKTIKIPLENDRKWAMCTSMVYLLWKGTSKEDEAKRIDGFYRICMELGAKNADFATYAMSTAMLGPTEQESQNHAMKLFDCKERYTEWAKLFGKAMKKHSRIEV